MSYISWSHRELFRSSDKNSAELSRATDHKQNMNIQDAHDRYQTWMSMWSPYLCKCSALISGITTAMYLIFAQTIVADPELKARQI